MYEIEELDPRIRVMTMEKNDHETHLMAHLVSCTNHCPDCGARCQKGTVSLGEGFVICLEYRIVSDSCFEFRNDFAIIRTLNASFLLNALNRRYLILDGPTGPVMY